MLLHKHKCFLKMATGGRLFKMHDCKCVYMFWSKTWGWKFKFYSIYTILMFHLNHSFIQIWTLLLCTFCIPCLRPFNYIKLRCNMPKSSSETSSWQYTALSTTVATPSHQYPIPNPASFYSTPPFSNQSKKHNAKTLPQAISKRFNTKFGFTISTRYHRKPPIWARYVDNSTTGFVDKRQECQSHVHNTQQIDSHNFGVRIQIAPVHRPYKSSHSSIVH